MSWEDLHSKNQIQKLHFFSVSDRDGIIYGYGQRQEVFVEGASDTEHWMAKAREIRFYRVQRIARPTVISSFPETGSMNVDTALTEITVTFSHEMNTEIGNTKTSYDRIEGELLRPASISHWQEHYDLPFYSRLWTRPIVPLEPNTKYALWLNEDKEFPISSRGSGFRSYEDHRYDSGRFNPEVRPLMIKAMPYLLIFTTGP